MRFEDYYFWGSSPPGRFCLSQKVGSEWKSWTRDQLAERAQQVASYLVGRGVQKGDRIGLVGENCPDWVAHFLGILSCGAIVIPIDSKLTAPELEQIIKVAEPRVIFASPSLAEMVMHLPSAGSDRLVVWGETFSPLSHQFLAVISDHDVAAILFTSGTTGRPKGVMISHRALKFETKELSHRMNLQPGEVFLSICPLNHLFEITCTLLCGLRSGVEICFSPSLYPADILQAMSQRRVTRMAVVPLFLKLMKVAMESQFVKLNPLARAYMTTARTLHRLFGFKSAAIRRALFAPIYYRLGFRFKEFVSGGAPLDPSVAGFFESIGIPVFEGYGMTETGPVISMNNLSHQKMGSVGLPLRETEVKIEDGEILVRGPQVMEGYFRDSELTNEVMTSDGFLRTGDLGSIDEEGFLHVTGRSKSLIVLDGGKKIQPEEIEGLVAHCSYVKEGCMVSFRGRDGCQRLALAIVVADEFKSRCLEDPTHARADLTEAIRGCLQQAAGFKRPQELAIVNGDLPKSSTRKVKRHDVASLLDKTSEEILWIQL